jgi:hypothetical protein
MRHSLGTDSVAKQHPPPIITVVVVPHMSEFYVYIIIFSANDFKSFFSKDGKIYI